MFKPDSNFLQHLFLPHLRCFECDLNVNGMWNDVLWGTVLLPFQLNGTSVIVLFAFYAGCVSITSHALPRYFFSGHNKCFLVEKGCDHHIVSRAFLLERNHSLKAGGKIALFSWITWIYFILFLKNCVRNKNKRNKQKNVNFWNKKTFFIPKMNYSHIVWHDNSKSI